MRLQNGHRMLTAMMVAVLGVAGCSDDDPVDIVEAVDNASAQRASNKLQCAPDNAGLTLPSGFCAIVVADLMMDGRPAAARHMAITPSGNLFVAINSRAM